MAKTNALTIGSWWRCRVRATDGRIVKILTVGSRAYPHGEVVTLGETASRVQVGDDALITAVLDDDGRVERFESPPHLFPAVPPLWFVEVPETTAQPPATNLMAFTGHGPVAGALVHHADFPDLGVPNEAQVAAVRWSPSSGRVDQLYVQPTWRRRGLSTALVATASTLAVAREWPELWGDGRRTELGEAMRRGVSWDHFMAELTHLHPPMTPDSPGE